MRTSPRERRGRAPSDRAPCGRVPGDQVPGSRVPSDRAPGDRPPRHLARAVLGFLLGWLARAWLVTLRVRVEAHPALDAVAHEPWVLAFFHGTQWPLLAWRRRRRTVVLVSLSADGALQARALSVLGFSVVRGSSSRGGVQGLSELVRLARGRSLDAAFAVDGPKGPYGTVRPGAAFAAKHMSGVLVPMGSAATPSRRTVFSRAWDRFVLAWPFSTVSVVLGPPIRPDAADPSRLGEAIEDANARARAILGDADDRMVRCGDFRGAARSSMGPGTSNSD